MCGIAGVYNFRSGRPVEPGLIEAMTNTMVYRGPDDAGVYADGPVGLGHRRLSILDLSPAGHQPITNQAQDLWLTFNGEIYNYLELMPPLRASGHVFKSTSDTEVILHGYREWGLDAVQQFNGMFAFCLWEPGSQRLILMRDRMGVKPLYYALNDDGIVFASEIKAILQHPAHCHAQADLAAVCDYVGEGYLAGERTLFKNIYKLLPGSWLMIENNEIKRHTYWQLPVSPQSSSLSLQQHIADLRELSIDAVKLRLRSDVPVGYHLSGGLDSSAIVSIARKELGVTPKTFSLRYSEHPAFDESHYMRLVVEDSRTEHYEYTPNVEHEFPERLQQMVYWLDEPADGPAVLSKYAINRLIKDHGITVLLTGQAADEILGGYKRFLKPLVADLLKHGQLGEFLKGSDWPLMAGSLLDHIALLTADLPNVVNKLFRYQQMGFHRNLFTNELHELISDGSPNHRAWRKGYPNVTAATPLAQTLHYESLYYLQSLLHSEDRTSMATSIETRTPFVDYRIVERVAQIPAAQKLKNFTMKYLLRMAMQGILPEPICWRKDKKGFPTPAGVWFRTSQKAFVEDILFSQTCRQRGVFNPKMVQTLWHEHQAGRDHTFKLWYVLNTELWFRQFIDAGARSSERITGVIAMPDSTSAVR